jgi:hypothetical protein
MDRDLLLDNIVSTVKTAKAFTWVALAVELQRDWAREETVADVIEIVLTDRLLKA